MRKLKLFFACLLMAVLSIGQVWGAPSMQAINGTTAAGSTTFSAANVASGTAGIVSWTSSNVSYSSNRVDFAANSSMTISVSSGYVITKVETNTATGSSDYYGSLTSTAGTKTVSNDKNYTFSGINAASVTLNNGSTAYRITSTGWIKVYYEESSGSNNPTISVDPEDATYGVGDAATALSVTAAPHTTGKTLSYKWYSNSSKSTEGAAQVGTSATYTPSTAAVGTTYYYCVVSEQDGGSATSDFATIQVKAKHTVTWNNNGSTSTTQVVEGAKPTFPAKPASCATDCDKFYGWATEAWTGKLTDISGKTIHTSNATMDAVTAEGTVYYAVFTDVVATDYSTTYTSNVTLPSSGTNVSSATLVIGENDDIDAFKLGKSGAGATSSFTVPSGTTKIYLHAAAWNGKTVSLTLATDVGSISPDDAQDLTSNSGIANSSPFTLNTTGTGFDFDDLFFEYTLENVDDEAEITVTATGERAVIWGVNAVASASSGDAHYMTTCAACTHLVDAPELNGAVVVTHNSATINWKTLTNASSYDVTVIRNSDSESIFSGNVNDLTKALTGLDPETQYDYSIMGVGDGSTYCTTGNGVLNGSFTTDAVPTAHLTLIDINGTHASSGDYVVGTPFNLPTTAATCAKTFVGWDANDECVTAPTYAKGASFTFANTTGVTLYAVYADMTGGSTSTTNIKCTVSTTTNMTGGNDADLLVDETDAADAGWVVTGYKGGGSNFPGLNKDGTIRLYYNASGNSYIDVTAPSTITSIAVTCKTGNNNIIVKVGENTIALAEDVYPINATSFRIINGYTESTQVHIQNIAVKFTNPGTPSNYSTTCIDAPTATPDENSIEIAAAGESSTLGVTYENVNLGGVNVTLYNDVDCSVAFDGGWLTASVAGDDKHIAYTAQANTSYNDARTAYIKLTAPETSSAASPAVVVIPVTQAKKAAVFASLQELVAADVNANTEVTVSFENVPIKSIYYYPNTSSENNRKGVVFNIQKAGQDIKIYYNAKVSEEWVAGGTLSGTLTNCPWKIYSEAWQLAPASGWAWTNLTYNNPPEIASIEIRGTATHKTYIDGQAFDPVGLSVIAIYDDNITEEDVTEFATWSYNPAKLSESDTEVTVTATYNEKSDDETVTGLTVNPIPNKTIDEFITAGGTRCYLEGIVGTIDNTTYGNFYLTDASGTIYVYGCLTPSGESKKFAELGVSQGDRIKVIAEAYTNHATKGHEAVNVVFVSKVSAATIDIDDIDMTEGDELLLSDIVATITPDAAQSAEIHYEVTAGTAVTISEGKIIASTEGEATITASIAAGEGYLAGSTTFTVTVSPAPVPFVGDYFVKVDDNSDLTAGEYLIVYEDGSLAFNGGLDPLDATSNYVAVTFENDKIQGTEAVLAATFTIKLAGTIQSKSDYYIGRTGDSNGMNTSKDEAYTNAISIDDNGNAVILASGGAYLRYNSADNQKRFRYFKSDSYTGQKAIQLYKKENAEPVYETVRENLTANRYYTVCLPKKVTAIKGASFWTLNNKSQDGAVAYLEEETNNLPFDAGKPFIIQATAEKLEVVYEGAATEDAGTNGALHGTLVYMDAAALAAAGSDVYMLFSNELRPVGENNHLDANRAYVLLSELNAVAEAPQSAPGKRVRAMPMQPQVATGIDALNASEQLVKLMINGQLFILRGEKLYDATGRLVK